MSANQTTGNAPGREALNAAFWELGLRFQWDEATWAALAPMASLQEQLRSYLERSQPHLMAMYDPESLARMIQQRLESPGSNRMGIEAHASV